MLPSSPAACLLEQMVANNRLTVLACLEMRQFTAMLLAGGFCRMRNWHNSFRNGCRGATIIVGIIALAGSVLAHHGWGTYDTLHKLNIEGNVKHLLWQNPHVHLHVQYKDAQWTIILGPVSRMQLRGLSAQTFKPSTFVAAQGFASKRRKREMRAVNIRIGGKTYEMR